MERAVIYVRQSTYRDESISLELQETACREHAARAGYDIVAVHADPGVSGRTFKRPGVVAAISMIEDHHAEVLLLWKWSRLSRNRLDWYVAADRLQQARGRIESATESIDTSTSIGRLSRGMMIELAAFESERIGDQWVEAHKRRVSLGLPTSGRKRFGYLYDTQSKTYAPDPHTGPVLTDLYARYIAGEGYFSLIQWLQRLSIKPPRGGEWTTVKLRAIMNGHFPRGLIQYRGEILPGAHEPLVDEATWAAYEQVRRGRSTRPRAESSPYLLSGLLRCKLCDVPLVGWTTKGRPRYYKCERSVLVAAYRHKPSFARAEKVEAAVLAQVRDLAEHAARTADIPTPNTTGPDVDQIRRDVERHRASLSRLTVQLAEDTISPEAYRGAAHTLEDKLATAQTALDAVLAEPALPSTTEAAAVTLWEDWDIMPIANRRAILGRLIQHATVDFPNDHNVQVIPKN